jgi:hypothetical protein
MTGSFHTTLQTLSAHPDVAKASGIGEERTLIIDMIQAMIDNPDVLDGMHTEDVAPHIIDCIRREIHRSNFDAS